MAAAELCDIHAMEQALLAGANVNTRDEHKQTALFCAAWNDNKAMIDLLVRHRININATDREGLTALSNGIRYGYLKLVPYMLQLGIDPYQPSNNYRTALHFAVIHNHRSVIPAILNAAPDLMDIADDQDGKPIDYATDEDTRRILTEFMQSRQENRELNESIAVDAAQERMSF